MVITVTPVALFGPLLRAVMVNSTLSRQLQRGADAVIAIAGSVAGPTFTSMLALSLFGFGS